MLVCHVPHYTNAQTYGHGLWGASQGARHCSMRCPIALLRPGVTMRLTRHSVASAVFPGLLPPPASGSGLPPAPTLATGGPQGSPRSPPRPCTPPESCPPWHTTAPPSRALTRRPAAEAAAGSQTMLAGLGVGVAAVALPPALQLGRGSRAEPPAPRHAGPGSTCGRAQRPASASGASRHLE